MSRKPAIWREQRPGWVWISHTTVKADDIDRLEGVERLTAWNVRFPTGFLARLTRLWWLDLRGGTSSDLAVVDGCSRLRGLVVNQVRGMTDLTAISELRSLELLSLYGLPRVIALPELSALPDLRRVELGQMRSLREWRPLAQVTNLEELVLQNTLDPDVDVMAALNRHRNLRTFDWHAPDEPQAKVRAVTEAVNRPPGRPVRSEDWFDS